MHPTLKYPLMLGIVNDEPRTPTEMGVDEYKIQYCPEFSCTVNQFVVEVLYPGLYLPLASLTDMIAEIVVKVGVTPVNSTVRNGIP